MWDDILLYVIIGFVAQMIDGAIGMAYGVTASSGLLSPGVPTAPATARRHAAADPPHRGRGRLALGPHLPPRRLGHCLLAPRQCRQEFAASPCRAGNDRRRDRC